MTVWREISFGDLVRFQNGRSFKSTDSGEFPVYGSNGIIGASPEHMYSDAIILGRVGAYCGAVFHCNDKFWATDNTIVVEPNKDIMNVRFGFYLLKHANLNRYAGGSAQPLLTQTNLRGLRFNVPNLNTQTRIASILGAYDDLIEVNLRRIAVLEAMARELFEEWFIRFRFPGHGDVLMVDGPNGQAPSGWSYQPLESLCTRITDGSHHSPASTEDGPMMASVRDMRNWGFDYSECRRISQSDFDALVKADCRPQIGDVLIAKDGANLNKHTFLVWKEEPIVLLSSVAIIRPSPTIDAEYLTAFFRSDGVSATIKNMKSGAAIPRIILRDFKRLQVLKPPPATMKRFGQTVGAMHAQCRVLSDANVRLAAARNLLLPRLISGELSVAPREPGSGAAA